VHPPIFKAEIPVVDVNPITFFEAFFVAGFPEEIAKFIVDVDNQNTHGIFLSQYSGIAFKQNYQIDIHKGKILVYIQFCEYSIDKIRIAVDIIDNLSCKLEDLTQDEESNTISKELLDGINEEYQKYTSQKEAMIVLLRDFQKKMSAQIDDIRFPELEKYLSQKYAYVKTACFTCDLCNNFSASSKQSLSAHKRGCSKKNKSVVEVGFVVFFFTLPSRTSI
jgi:hypothetical protein